MDEATVRRMGDVPHPGVRLKEELGKRGWTQADLIYVLGCAPKTVNMIINGKQGVSPAMSKALGEVFDLPHDYFADLQTEFEVAGADEPDPSVRTRARICKSYPVRDMIRRGWLPENPDQLEMEFAGFFGEGETGRVPYISHAAKKTSYGDDVPAAQLAWIFRVRQVARAIAVPAFSSSKLLASVREMRDMLIAPEEARHVPRKMAECGVRFVIVEALQGAKIDGICLWLSENEPVIGMSLRHDRIDNFWFVLRHEIEHVLRGDGKDSDVGVVDTSLEGEERASVDELPEAEKSANAAASDFCVPENKIASFIRRKNPFFYEKDVVAFSKLNGIHPGLTVGQIQRATGRWSYLKKYQVPIRAHVLPGAIVDGYGQSVPLN